MINQLFSIVEQHIQGSKYPQQFSVEYNSAPPNTFDEALNFVKRFTSQSGIQVPGRISAINSQSSVLVGGANTSTISQPGQITTTTTTTTTNEQQIANSGLVATTTVNGGLSSPLHYTLNPAVHQQQTSFVPQRSLRVIPAPQSALLTSVGSSQGFIQGGSQTFLPPPQQVIQQQQPIAIQRPIVQQSISLPPTQSTLKSVITSQQ